jgi:phospholipid/cholesterol/gamma-HCH transport system ATP-binding protein
MVGLLTPDVGDIMYDGRSFNNMSKQERKEIRREIGMLFQGSALFDSMTVEDNIKFPLDMFSTMTEKEKKERVNECLEQVNMPGINKKFPDELSGGMKKRVGIARAIVLNPKYLFCDEPNSGLDPKTAIVIDELIQELTQQFQMTTLINTHDMNSVMEIGDHVVFLFEGRKYWEGNSKEIMQIEEGELYDFIFASDFLKDLRRRAKY